MILRRLHKKFKAVNLVTNKTLCSCLVGVINDVTRKIINTTYLNVPEMHITVYKQVDKWLISLRIKQRHLHNLHQNHLPTMTNPNKVVMNRFILLRKIGKGGFGIVYKARDLTTGVTVAIKENTRSDKSYNIRENNILCHIGHLSYFPTLFQSGYSKGREFVVMSLEGVNLWKFACQNPEKKLTKRNMLLFIYHATKAVDAFHQMGFVHRDIKPSNFVFGKSSGKAPVLLVDFGTTERFDVDGFQIPSDNFMNLPQSSPKVLRGGKFTTMADWFLMVISILNLAGYKKTWAKFPFMTCEERATYHEDRLTSLKFELLHDDQYLVPIIEQFYTPGVDKFHLDSLLCLLLTVEDFNPGDQFVTE